MDILSEYEKVFGERIFYPRICDIGRFEKAVKQAILTKKPINMDEWASEGTYRKR